MEQKLLDAFRYHRRNLQERDGPARYHTATLALQLARCDLASIPPRLRYPANTIYPAVTWQESSRIGPHAGYVETPANAGLRFVGRVIPETRSGQIWATGESTAVGWYSDPYGESSRDGTGLVWGEIYQLPGSRGRARFVAAYRHGGMDDGPLVLFGDIFEESVRGNRLHVWDYDAARDAARYADSCAERAAKIEMEYQRAALSGSRWRDCVDAIASIRRELKSLFAERKTARPADQFPTMCAAIKRDIGRQWDEMNAARKERDTWAAGSGSVGDYYMGFERRNPDHVAAFCDAAGLKEMPA